LVILLNLQAHFAVLSNFDIQKYYKQALEKDFGMVFGVGKDFKEKRRVDNISLTVSDITKTYSNRRHIF
jgi:hypothetical protein